MDAMLGGRVLEAAERKGGNAKTCRIFNSHFTLVRWKSLIPVGKSQGNHPPDWLIFPGRGGISSVRWPSLCIALAYVPSFCAGDQETKDHA